MPAQLDLFGTAAPSPARRPARPDTALLLAMSADHAPACSAPRPNAHGVYAPGETLSLLRQDKGWKGSNIGDIHLVDLGPHWLWAVSYQLFGGDCRGGGQPLSDREQWRAPTRAAAIEAAAQALRQRIKDCDGTDARRLRAWLDDLGRG